jgi:hypothetical protein
LEYKRGEKIMNIYECIVISLIIVVIGLWGLMFLGNKYGLLEDEKKNAKKAYEDNLKKVSGQDLVKAQTKARKTVEKSLKGKDTSTVKVEVRTAKIKTDSGLNMPKLPTEAKSKRGRKPVKKGEHLD